MVTVTVRNGNMTQAIIALRKLTEKDGIQTELKARALGKRGRERWKQQRAARRRQRSALRRSFFNGQR